MPNDNKIDKEKETEFKMEVIDDKKKETQTGSNLTNPERI